MSKHASLPPAPPRRMPTRTVPVELDGDYDGWNLTMWSNPPLEVFDVFATGDFAKTREVLATLIFDWNFVDYKGEPLPAANEGGLNKCPPDLLSFIMQGYNEALTNAATLPKASPTPSVTGSTTSDDQPESD